SSDYRTFDFTNSGESVFGSSSSYAIFKRSLTLFRPVEVSSSSDYRTFDFTNSGESVFGSSSSYAIFKRSLTL
ncbi:hypothetical protein, partial [Escherichia coli]|uniref:hypothetical protein n=1 Tax=Escherichia coli TaxID=562 RepID=UPI0018740693